MSVKRKSSLLLSTEIIRTGLCGEVGTNYLPVETLFSVFNSPVHNRRRTDFENIPVSLLPVFQNIPFKFRHHLILLIDCIIFGMLI